VRLPRHALQRGATGIEQQMEAVSNFLNSVKPFKKGENLDLGNLKISYLG
jgi:hypothetical protein